MRKSKKQGIIFDTQYGEEQGIDEDDESQDDFNSEEKKKKKEKIIVNIETLNENPEKISPIIGYFPSRYDPLNNRGGGDVNLAATEESMPEVKVYKNVKRSNRYKIEVNPNSSSRVKFVGTNYSGEAATPQQCTYALGVLDKSTQTLKVVPITANKIFRLEPRVGGVDDDPQKSDKLELTEEQKDEEKKKLHMYLPKRTIREFKKRELLNQHDDPETQKDIDMTIQGLKMDKEALEGAPTTANSGSIPPHDVDATTPSRAYPLEKIIFKGEWDYLLDIFDLSQAGSAVSADIYPSFVRNRVYKLDDIKDEVEKKKLAGILSYITHLVKFKDKHSMETISAAKHHKIPGILFQKFSSMFSDSGLKLLPDDKRSLLISYVLVLTLVVDDFRTDPSDIASDLRINPLTLRQHYEILGCKLVREKQHLLATLPVPLKFSSARRRKRSAPWA